MIDEPSAGRLGNDDPSPGAASVEALRQLVSAWRAHGALVGLHCCARLRGNLVRAASPDLLSFDATIEPTVFADGDLIAWHDDGGIWSPGLVATSSRARESAVAAADRWIDSTREFGAAPLRGPVSAACGLATLEEADAELVCRLVRETGALIRRAGSASH